MSITSITQLSHLQIPLEEILKATNNFSEENIIRKGGFGIVYKGEILRSGELINISAKRLDRSQGLGDVEFLTEVSVLSILKHPNIVSLIGFCDEKGEKIIIYRHAAKGTLGMHLSDPALNWMDLLKISIGVASALSYLHYEEGRHHSIIHGNINSSTILLDENNRAMLTGFEFSISDSMDRMERFIPSEIIRTLGYMDPESIKSGYMTQKSDIYSFGVVLCEIMCRREAFLPNESEDNKFLAPLFRFHKECNTLNDIIHPGILNLVTSDSDSFKLFVTTAYACINKIHEERLDMTTYLHFLKSAQQDWKIFIMNVVMARLHPSQRQLVAMGESTSYSGKLVAVVETRSSIAWAWKDTHKDGHLKIPLIDIESATQYFSRENHIGGGEFGMVYKGKLASKHGSSTIAAKRLVKGLGHGDQQFYNELHILSEYKHENVIGLIGYNNDEHERIIVLEYASKGSLENYVNDARLSWINRLNICIDVARGLAFLHRGVREHEAVIHRDMRPAKILLFDGWKAKVADFGTSLICTTSDETEYENRYFLARVGYADPQHQKSGFLTKQSDIYAFGVVLLEILCGRTTMGVHINEGQFLSSLAKQRFEEGRFDEVVFKAIKNQIVPEALVVFQKISFLCLHDDREKRPRAQEVLDFLQIALELQVKDVPVCKMKNLDIC